MVADTKSWLSLNFEMNNMGEAIFVLGIKLVIGHSKRLLGLSQATYIKRVLEIFKKQNGKHIDTQVKNYLSLDSSPTNESERNK